MFKGARFALILALALSAGSAVAAQRQGRFWTNSYGGISSARRSRPPDFIALAAKLGPTVVNISSEEGPPLGDLTPQAGSQPGDSGSSNEYQPRSLGSGFIINSRGYILTNDHVIEDAKRILVTTKDGNEYTAKLVGRDKKSDIALIKINPRGELPVAPLGNSDNLHAGQWVMAIGNPFGFDHSVTAGIVSAIGRFIPGNYDDFIQTDASINPGNSGGPLIDLSGAVVGVNSAIFTRTGGSTGIGFAVPINLVKAELPQLRYKGRVVRGWLGVYIRKVTPKIAESEGLGNPRGALVSEVLRGGPAQQAGLKRGDVILAYNNRQIRSSQELPLLVGSSPIGENATVRIVRDRSMREITVRILASREARLSRASAFRPPAPASFRFGLQVKNLNAQLATELGMHDGGGVVVASVARGSSADRAGLRAHDVILEVNRRLVKSAAAYERAVKSATPDKPVLLLVQREGKTVFVPVGPDY